MSIFRIISGAPRFVLRKLSIGLKRIRYGNYFCTFVLCGSLVVAFLVCKFVPLVPEYSIPWLRDNSGDPRVDLLTYVSTLATVMIPIYLLIAEQKIGIGKIGSFALLRYVNFREIAFLLVTQAALMLCIDMGKKTDYLAITLMTASLVTVVYALVMVLRVLFQDKSSDEILKGIIRKNVIPVYFDTAVYHRGKRNTIYKDMGDSDHIDIYFTAIDKSEYEKIPVKSGKEGQIEGIDIKAIDALASRLFGIEAKETTGEVSIDSSQTSPRVKIEFNVLCYDLVKPNSDICSIYLLKGFDDYSQAYRKIEKLKKCIVKNVKISKQRNKSITLVTDWLDEVEREIDQTRSIEGAASLDQVLNWYEMIVEELDVYIDKKSKMSLEDAESDLDAWQKDHISQAFHKVYKIMINVLDHEIRYGNSYRLSAAYRLAYGIADDVRYPTAVARSHRWLRHIVYLSLDASVVRGEVFERSMKLYIDHVSGILYRTRSRDYGEGEDLLPASASVYLDDVRGMLLNAIKKWSTGGRHEKLFGDIVKVLERHLHQDIGYRRSLLPDGLDEKLSNIFLLVAVYTKYKDRDGQYRMLTRVIKGWKLEYVTARVLDCYDNDLIRKWNIDTFDIEADGELHSTPDINNCLRRSWIDIMKISDVVDELYVKNFFHTTDLEKTLFFTGGAAEFNHTPFYRYRSDMSESLLRAVKECCQVRWDWENNQLVNAPLDQQKVDEFYQKAEDSFEQQSIMTKILPKSKLKLHKSLKAEVEGYRQYGLNTVFDKEAFIKEWHVGLMVDDVASDIGRQAAIAEDSEILKSITGDAEKIDIDEIDVKTERANGDWVVVLQNIDVWNILLEHKDICDEKSDHMNGKLYIKGLRQKLPAFELYDNTGDEKILFVRRSTLGLLEYKSDSGGNLESRIEPFSEHQEQVEDLIKRRPDWLKEQGSTDEKMRKYLYTKVSLYVNRIFRYTPSGHEEVFECSLTDGRTK